ncbi:MAG: nucleotidyltransferase [candidate division Zixibacteria bacterium]|nr:nucleotidyltransferase [candidate division Zixibacteria bacterium]
MATPGKLFNDLLERIEPPDARAKKAVKLPTRVRAHLETSEKLGAVEPYTLLTGSYKRHTAIGEIKDVDIMVFLDPKMKDEKPEVAFSLLRDALNDLPGRLKTDITPQRRSIRVTLEDQDFTLDLVPCVAPFGTEQPLLVPDRPREQWIWSDPLGYAAALSDLNGKRYDIVVPMIKLLKAWRDGRRIYMRPKSYWIECLVYSVLSAEGVVSKGDSHATVISRVFDAVHQRFAWALNQNDVVPQILDPRLGNNVASGWERGHFEAFMNNLSKSMKLAHDALATSEDDEGKKEAVRLWTEVFGEKWFEGTIYAEAMRTASGVSAGTVVVRSTGLLAPIGGREKGFAIPEHRFYGA